MRNFWIVIKMPTFGNEEVEDAIRRGRVDATFSIARENTVKEFFLTEEAANRNCTKLAAENPLRPYAIMQINTILETGAPNVLTKKFNEQNELIIV